MKLRKLFLYLMIFSTVLFLGTDTSISSDLDNREIILLPGQGREPPNHMFEIPCSRLDEITIVPEPQKGQISFLISGQEFIYYVDAEKKSQRVKAVEALMAEIPHAKTLWFTNIPITENSFKIVKLKVFHGDRKVKFSKYLIDQGHGTCAGDYIVNLNRNGQFQMYEMNMSMLTTRHWKIYFNTVKSKEAVYVIDIAAGKWELGEISNDNATVYPIDHGVIREIERQSSFNQYQQIMFDKNLLTEEISQCWLEEIK